MSYVSDVGSGSSSTYLPVYVTRGNTAAGKVAHKTDVMKPASLTKAVPAAETKSAAKVEVPQYPKDPKQGLEDALLEWIKQGGTVDATRAVYDLVPAVFAWCGSDPEVSTLSLGSSGFGQLLMVKTRCRHLISPTSPKSSETRSC